MEVSFNSYYLYKKYEKRSGQPWIPVYPETLSIDGDGSMPKVLKTSGDPACYVEPQERWVDTGGYACEEISIKYRWTQTQDTICIEKFDGKYKLILNNHSVVSASCDSTSAITSGEVATQYSGTVVSAEIGDCVTSIDNRAFDYCRSLTSVTIPNSVTNIGNGAFGDCSGLTSVVIPSSVTSIGVQAFMQCFNLTGITIPSSVTSVGQAAFNNCWHLKTVTCNAASIDFAAFGSNDELTAVTLGSSVTNIADGAFVGCNNLSSMTIDNGNRSYRYENGVLFNYTKSDLVQFFIGNGLTNYIVPNSINRICGYAFTFCSGLTSVTIGNSVTSIGSMAFYNCSSLTSVNIPIGITTINEETFYGCHNLTGVTIPDNVTTIGRYAFAGCFSFTSVTIPDSVITINDGAFNACTSLASVTVNATTPPALGSNVFDNTPIASGTGYIYVPTASVNAYKSASGWSNYASRIRA